MIIPKEWLTKEVSPIEVDDLQRIDTVKYQGKKIDESMLLDSNPIWKEYVMRNNPLWQSMKAQWQKGDQFWEWRAQGHIRPLAYGYALVEPTGQVVTSFIVGMD
jgi:hypothetical protein